MVTTRGVEVKPLPGYCLWVRFDDGLEGTYAVQPERRSGVFQRLCDPAVFNAVQINADFGCVEWPGGVDLCPNAMHAEMTQASLA
jgi:hypothetical protein